MHITSNWNLMELFHQKWPPIQSSLTLLIFFFFSRIMSSKCIYQKIMRKKITIPLFKTVCCFATHNFLMAFVSNPL